MPYGNFWNKSVPKAEYDHRARDARLRLEQIERLLVKRDAAVGPRYFGVLRLLGVNISGSGRRRGQRTGSPSDRWPCAMSAAPCWHQSSLRCVANKDQHARPRTGATAYFSCHSALSRPEIRGLFRARPASQIRRLAVNPGAGGAPQSARLGG